ncbi:MAG: hypothetical protein ACLUD1_06165 [Clostridia bacterium]
MEEKESLVKRVCSFYVSDWHLATMILPYLNKVIENNEKIKTILEKDIEENIKTLISKLNLKDEKKLLQINFKQNKILKYKDFVEFMKDEIEKNKEILLFINGRNEYIEIINKNINNWIRKNKKVLIKKNCKIKVLNCYEVTEFNSKMTEILDKHDLILNTSGEKQIEEVFEGYTKKAVND